MTFKRSIPRREAFRLEGQIFRGRMPSLSANQQHLKTCKPSSMPIATVIPSSKGRRRGLTQKWDGMGRKESKKRKAGKGIERMGWGEAKKDRVRGETERVKGKGSPYSTAEHRVPELIPVLGSQPAGNVSHKPGSRLPLLSARPAVTLATLERAATNFATNATNEARWV